MADETPVTSAWQIDAFMCNKEVQGDDKGVLVSCPGLQPTFVPLSDEELLALDDPNKRSTAHTLYKNFGGLDTLKLVGEFKENKFAVKGFNEVSTKKWAELTNSKRDLYESYIDTVELSDASTVDKDYFRHLKKHGLICNGYDDSNSRYSVLPNPKKKKTICQGFYE